MAKGEKVRPALYSIIEGVVTVDGGQGNTLARDFQQAVSGQYADEKAIEGDGSPLGHLKFFNRCRGCNFDLGAA